MLTAAARSQMLAHSAYRAHWPFRPLPPPRALAQLLAHPKGRPLDSWLQYSPHKRGTLPTLRVPDCCFARRMHHLQSHCAARWQDEQAGTMAWPVHWGLSPVRLCCRLHRALPQAPAHPAPPSACARAAPTRAAETPRPPLLLPMPASPAAAAPARSAVHGRTATTSRRLARPRCWPHQVSLQARNSRSRAAAALRLAGSSRPQCYREPVQRRRRPGPHHYLLRKRRYQLNPPAHLRPPRRQRPCPRRTLRPFLRRS